MSKSDIKLDQTLRVRWHLHQARVTLVWTFLAATIWLSRGMGFVESTSDSSARAAEIDGVDYYGDPLPSGVTVRLGTSRLRPGGGAVTFSPDDKVVASWGGGQVQLSDVATGKTLCQFRPHFYAAKAAHFGKDGTSITTVGHVDAVTCHWSDGPKTLSRMWGTTTMLAAAFSPDGATLAIGNRDGAIMLCKAATHETLRTLREEGGRVLRLRYSPCGRFLASATLHIVSVWNLATGTEHQVLSSEEYDRFSLAFSPDSRTLVVGSNRKGTVGLYYVATGKPLLELPETEPEIQVVEFSPDGTLAYAGMAGNLHLCNPENPTRRRTMRIGYYVNDLDFSSDGKTLAVATSLFGHQRTLLIDVATGEWLHDYPHQGQTIRRVEYSPDGRTLATSSTDRTIRVWEASTGRPIYGVGRKQPSKECHYGPGLAFSPDGRTLAAADDAQVQMLDATTGKEMGRFPSLAETIVAIDFAPDGKTWATVSVDWVPECRSLVAECGSLVAVPRADLRDRLTERRQKYPPGTGPKVLHVRDRVSGKSVLKISKISDKTYDVKFSPSGELLATLGYHDVTLWHSNSGTKLRAFPGFGFAFSPDGKICAVGCKDRMTRLYRLPSCEQIQQLPGPKRSAHNALAFSPGGRFLAAAGPVHSPSDGWSLRIYDLEIGKIVWKQPKKLAATRGITFPLDSGFADRKATEFLDATCVTFSPDGKHLVAGGNGGGGWIWRLSPELVDPRER